MSYNNTITKIAVVGGGGVGKSCVTLKFLQNKFVEQYDPTIQEIYRKSIIVDEEAAFLDILDTAGQEEYKTLTDRYFRNSHAFLCVISYDQRGSIGQIREYVKRIQRAKDEDEIVGLLVCNKCDIAKEERAITEEEVKKLSLELNLNMVECSAKTGENINDLFFTLVRNLRKKENDEYEQTFLNKKNNKKKKKKNKQKTNRRSYKSRKKRSKKNHLGCTIC
ncbi:ras-like protein [Anaeramoeba flamelloides]|uniref:Ras-like protein n=1 Tax=Anaeramoeba flamelloides TaxID=1746091 RepID=A0ABQ8X587_9EUKA|nr:ras-like protein [Anaeramoeba flamelloides]